MATPIIFKKRVSILTFLVVLVFIYLTIRLAYLQLVIGPELHAKAMNQWAQEVPTEPKRGTIFDRRGKELAISANADTVVALPGRIINPKQTAKKLAKVLNVAEDRIYELITRKKYLVYVARKVSASEATAVRALNLPGITFQIETRRYYPYQNLASHVLGFVGID
ncbi:MAG: stage V sporulation protein D, partial [bacterium]|nr:stage V sporulation protein D [bacterium]